MLQIARADKVCQRLMTTPGVGALVALTYRSAVDDPSWFGKSSTVGAYFGLTPKKYRSGETDRDGGVSKVGDAMVRTALFEAAHIMLTPATRFSSLKRWALDVAQRRGMKRAKVALARKLDVVLHRMWMDNMPAVGRTLVSLHRRYREGVDRSEAMAAQLGDERISGGPARMPFEQVRDFFYARHNHVEPLDEAAERLYAQAGLGPGEAQSGWKRATQYPPAPDAGKQFHPSPPSCGLD